MGIADVHVVRHTPAARLHAARHVNRKRRLDLRRLLRGNRAVCASFPCERPRAVERLGESLVRQICTRGQTVLGIDGGILPWIHFLAGWSSLDRRDDTDPQQEHCLSHQNLILHHQTFRYELSFAICERRSKSQNISYRICPSNAWHFIFVCIIPKVTSPQQVRFQSETAISNDRYRQIVYT